MAVPAASARIESVLDSTEDPLLGYDAKYLDCRGMSHSWVHLGFFREPPYITRMTKCQRCGCEKLQTMNARTAEIVGSPRYSHPEGYLFQGYGFISKQEVRRETIQRFEQGAYGSAEDLRKANLRSVGNG